MDAERATASICRRARCDNCLLALPQYRHSPFTVNEKLSPNIIMSLNGIHDLIIRQNVVISNVWRNYLIDSRFSSRALLTLVCSRGKDISARLCVTQKGKEHRALILAHRPSKNFRERGTSTCGNISC